MAKILKESTKRPKNFRFVTSDRAETQNFLYDQGVADLMEGVSEFPDGLEREIGGWVTWNSGSEDAKWCPKSENVTNRAWNGDLEL